MKTKSELLRNIIVAEEMLKDIKEDFLDKTKDSKDEEIYLYYNTNLIKRNRIVINQKLKELERYE